MAQTHNGRDRDEGCLLRARLRRRRADPSLSIPRQLGKCDQVLKPIGEKVGVNFWDLESGRKALDERGEGKREWSEVVDVPRAGGPPELLASAKEGKFDAVIIESIEQVQAALADD